MSARRPRNRLKNPSGEVNLAGWSSFSGGLTVNRALDKRTGGTPNPAPTQRHPNPDVETNATGWADQSTAGGVTVTALTRTTDWAFSGSYSMFMHRQNAADSVLRTLSIITSPGGTAGFPVVAGETLRGRARLNVLLSDATTNFRVQFVFRDAGGTIVGSTSSGAAAATGLTGEMTLEHATTVPATAAFAQMLVNCAGSNAWEAAVYVDALFVTREQELPGTGPLTITPAWEALMAGTSFAAWSFTNPDATNRSAQIRLAPAVTTDPLAIPCVPGELLRFRVAVHMSAIGSKGYTLALSWRTAANANISYDSVGDTDYSLEPHIMEMTAVVPPDAYFVQPLIQSNTIPEAFTFAGYADAATLTSELPGPHEVLPYDPQYTVHLIGDTHTNSGRPSEDPEWRLDQGDRNLLQLFNDVRYRGLRCAARLHVGDFNDQPEDETLPAATLAMWETSINDDVPLYVAPGNHDVQFNEITMQEWANRMGYDAPSQVVDLPFARFILVAQSDTNDTVDDATIAWAKARADEVPSKRCWIITHRPMQNTAGGDATRYFTTATGFYVKPVVEWAAMIDSCPNIEGQASGHIHSAHDAVRTPDYIMDKNVGSRTIVHASVSCPAYTGSETVTRRPVRSYFLELLPGEAPRIHIRDHLRRCWMSDPSGLPVPYVVEYDEPTPAAYFDGGTPGFQWDGAEHNSTSRARVPPRLRSNYRGDKAGAMRQMLNLLS